MTDQQRDVRAQLNALCEEKFAAFSSTLIPGMTNLIGVRVPALRKLAKALAKQDPRYRAPTDGCYEEILLEGMVIGYVQADVEQRLRLIEEFVPKIDNWSVCDGFCVGLKFTKENVERVLAFLQPYLQSEQEYQIRFGVVMLLNYYVLPHTIDRVLAILGEISHPAYYVKMAVAWAICSCYVKFETKTVQFLENANLDMQTYNLAVKKICESNQVDIATKNLIRKTKRK